ncbi:MAG: threonylcarbamoyl-AMP synthase [Puniceicoccales bacterium]|jgi:L-threonylcarbamoyladenylate synthase|nr:threonylcarbamoyl-AMP synthase [Puniceicoccales bacterium]
MVVNGISLAVKLLRRDDVVALPTETVYGLAASIKSEVALRKIFQIKGRPLLDPLIVHLLDYNWISEYAHIDGLRANVKVLADAFWPGPLTIILQKKPMIPAIVTAGSDFVALRCPAHEIFRKVLKSINVPLAAPSANPFGCLSPTTAKHVQDSLGDKIPLIIDGGPCRVGIESTILDVTSDMPRILRPGAISASDIAQTLKTPVLDHSPSASSAIAPGQLKQHYSPNTRLILVEMAEDLSLLVKNASSSQITGKAAFVYLKRPHDFYYADVFWLSNKGDYFEAARSLFDMLQNLDKAGYDVIYCQKAEQKCIGIAINDRLTRAAAKFAN